MAGEDKLVSIIVPVYNAGNFIERTVASVKAQTYQKWELLLVDDRSADDSRQKIERLAAEDAERIRVLVQECNKGAAAARNAGLEAAKGRYIAFLDADDIWMPQKLELELAFLESKKAAFVFTAYEFGDEAGEGTGKIVHVPSSLTYRQALSRTVIFTSTVLFDSEKIGRELIRMPQVKSEDSATWWKILREGFTAYGLDQVLAVYRRPRASLSSNKVEAVRRIWNLYRNQEELSLPYSLYNLFFWAIRATLRRI